MDADHLARVSKCWDLDVVEFRERLRERDIDDDAVASLQEAIRESAYEHFVVTGMRRYLLNRDKGDGGEGGGWGRFGRRRRRRRRFLDDRVRRQLSRLARRRVQDIQRR